MHYAIRTAAASAILAIGISSAANAALMQPIEVTVTGAGSGSPGTPAPVELLIDYATGPGPFVNDVQTISQFVVDLRGGTDTNANFPSAVFDVSSATIFGGSFVGQTNFSFSNGNSVLTVDIGNDLFDQGESLSFSVNVVDLCAGCATPNSGEAFGFTGVPVSLTVKDTDTLAGTFSVVDATTSQVGFGPVAVAVPEPSILALFGFGLVGLGFLARRQRAAAN